jgi:hypothetical protein
LTVPLSIGQTPVYGFLEYYLRGAYFITDNQSIL